MDFKVERPFQSSVDHCGWPSLDALEWLKQ